jgi:hypothetical protein
VSRGIQKKVTLDKAFHARSRIWEEFDAQKVLVVALNGFANPRVSYDVSFLQTVNCRLTKFSPFHAFVNFVCTAKIEAFLD